MQFDPSSVPQDTGATAAQILQKLNQRCDQPASRGVIPLPPFLSCHPVHCDCTALHGHMIIGTMLHHLFVISMALQQRCWCWVFCSPPWALEFWLEFWNMDAHSSGQVWVHEFIWKVEANLAGRVWVTVVLAEAT